MSPGTFLFMISLNYMGRGPLSTTRAKTRRSTWAALARSIGALAGIGGRAGGQDIIDQDDATALDLGLEVGRYLECALHICRALGQRQADLLLGRAHPAQHLTPDLDPALPRDD